MKTTKNILLGLAASLLFAVGFARAADRLDSVVQGLPSLHSSSNVIAPSSGCTLPCASGGGDNLIAPTSGCTLPCASGGGDN